MARALIGKEEDDEITVETPSGKIQLYVNRIWYEKGSQGKVRSENSVNFLRTLTQT